MKIRPTATFIAAAAVAVTACSGSYTDYTDYTWSESDLMPSNFVLAIRANEGGLESAFDHTLYQAVDARGEVANGISREIFIYTMSEPQGPDFAQQQDDAFSNYPPYLLHWVSTPADPSVTGIPQTEFMYLDPDGDFLWGQVYMTDQTGQYCHFDSIPIEESPTSCADVQE